MKIYGAGIAGLLAASQFQKATIYEYRKADQFENHKALLRFRTPAVGDSVGIEFRKVRVNKGIWSSGKFVPPSIQLANSYSIKVADNLSNRSIWNLDTVDRYVAPENFIAQLVERCANRIVWEHKITAEEAKNEDEEVISTLPMELLCEFFADEFSMKKPDFCYAPIMVQRYLLPDSDVFQTVYFPDKGTTLYRASITGDLLIVEYKGGIDTNLEFCDAFGIGIDDCKQLDTTFQRYGKITTIEENWRKEFVFRLSHELGIYSLGRFGTWRNIILDDVLKDISVIKKLMNTTSYDKKKHNSKIF